MYLFFGAGAIFVIFSCFRSFKKNMLLNKGNAKMEKILRWQIFYVTGFELEKAIFF